MQPAPIGLENAKPRLQQQGHDPKQLPEGTREKLHRRWDATLIHVADGQGLTGKKHGSQAHQQRAAQIAG